MKTILIALTVLFLAPSNLYARTSLEKMSLAFKGGYSVSQVKSLLDPVMTSSNLALTEENYNRAGSVLVVMRKEYGVNEMTILRCMKSAYSKSKSNVSFSDMAAICVVALKK